MMMEAVVATGAINRKAPVKSSPPNTRFLTVAKPTMSNHWRENITIGINMLHSIWLPPPRLLPSTCQLAG